MSNNPGYWDSYNYESWNPPRKTVEFRQLHPTQQIAYTRNEFIRLAKYAFECPGVMLQWLTEKKITEEQAKGVLVALNKLCRKSCFCCRRFDQMLLTLTPIDPELEPLLHIAQDTVKAKFY